MEKIYFFKPKTSNMNPVTAKEDKRALVFASEQNHPMFSDLYYVDIIGADENGENGTTLVFKLGEFKQHYIGEKNLLSAEMIHRTNDREYHYLPIEYFLKLGTDI